MPHYEGRILPAEWQIVRRWSEEANAERYWLQRLDVSSGAWRDVSGPYRQRGAAYAYYQRRRIEYLSDQRKALATHGTTQHEHEWQQRRYLPPFCAICGAERTE
jgi:hypothetical protein